MKMWHLIFLLSAMYGCTYALTEEDLKMDMMKLIIKCNKDVGLDMMELMELQKFIVPTKSATKCVLACAYKEAKIMTADGLYSLDYAYSVAELLKNGDEQRVANGKKMADICVKVNDVKVSDGEKGCERAVLIYKCTIDYASKFGFKL